MSIVQAIVKVKVEGAGRAIMDALVSFDPKGMSEAELVNMEQKLDQLGRSVITARNDAAREEAEFKAASKKNRDRLRAAEVLQGQVDALPEGSPDRASKEASLASLVQTIEDAQPDLEREGVEAKEAKKYLGEIETAHTEAVRRLKSAKANLKSAENAVNSANRRRDRANDKANAAAVSAGIRQNTDRIGSALDAMNRLKKQADDDAAAAELKASSLAPKSDADDPNIAAAMMEAEGTAAPRKSVSDRLRALKAKAA